MGKFSTILFNIERCAIWVYFRLYNLFWYKTLRRIWPKYHYQPIGKRCTRRWLWQKLRYGIDQFECGDLYYYISKRLARDLSQYIKYQRNIQATPYDYIKKVTLEYKQKHKYIEGSYRFEDKRIQRKVDDEAFKLWIADLVKMQEAFQDVVDDEDDWQNWHNRYKSTVKELRNSFNKCKTEEERKALWNMLELDKSRPYVRGILPNELDLSAIKRKTGWKLFAEHINDLWW